MKKSGFVLTAATHMLAAVVFVGIAEPRSATAQSTSAYVSVVSDYRFRGISQTFRRPALQAGVDCAPGRGFYVGTWGASIYGTDEDFAFSKSGGKTRDLARTSLVLSISKLF